MGATLSYAQLDTLSRAFAAWLQKKSGLSPGDRVALMMPNILQYPIALFGVLRAGMVVVNTNPLYTPRELEHQLKDSGAKAIVIVENFVHVLQQVLPRTDLKKVLVTGVGDLLGVPRGFIVNFVLRHVRKQIPAWNMPGSIDVQERLGQRPRAQARSGALGRGGHRLSAIHRRHHRRRQGGGSHPPQHGGQCAASLGLGESLAQGQRARSSSTALPLYHIFALTTNCLAFLSLGARNVLITNPRDFKAFVAELKKYKFNFISGVNTLFNALLHTAGIRDRGLQRAARHLRRRHGPARSGGRRVGNK